MWIPAIAFVFPVKEKREKWARQQGICTYKCMSKSTTFSSVMAITCTVKYQ
ncbi:Uncharacterised protein [Vibrio cholerae]|nr:Uncharacterised protein [Vibrio cholerae]